MFTKRTSKPGKGNKHYIRKASGGWSVCITGKPTDSECNVLSNCVGYAIGRSSEIYTEYTGYQGNKFNNLNGDAENFVSKAKNQGLTVSSVPKAGAIMCWAKGKVGVNSDGAGHVCVVERVNSNGTVYTSESGWNSRAFWNSTRSNSNGRWGQGSAYSFLGFIYNPAVKDLPDITPTVARDIYVDQLEVKTLMNVRVGAGIGNESLGTVSEGSIFNRYESKEDGGYTWYRIADNQWIANNIESTYLTVYNAEPKPVPTGLQVGDKVKIIAGLASSSNAISAPHTASIGWERYITAIYEGRNYPYQVGNKGDTSSKGTTGFAKESALKKL